MENLSDDFLQYSVRAHLETGSLPTLDLFDLKTIFCIVVNNGGVDDGRGGEGGRSGGGGSGGGGRGSEGRKLAGRKIGSGVEGWGRSASFEGWNCRYVDYDIVPANNVVCGNRIVISKRWW